MLPLANMSGDAANDYLGAGLAESLITSLASAPQVTVLSRGAVEESRQQNPDRASFVRALDANYLVTGSVHAIADRLRVTLNLERSDASVAWGETVEGATSDLFDLQKRLATLLGNAIADQTPSGERAEPAAAITSSGPAQLAYWKGRALLDRRDLTGNTRAALQEFERALAADPKFATAHAGLAEAQWAMYQQTNDKRWAQRAMASTRTAIALEPDRPSVRYIAALTAFRERRYDSARTELERALPLQPTYEDAIRLHGTVLMRQGDVDEGLAEFRPGRGDSPERRGRAIPIWASRSMPRHDIQEALERIRKSHRLVSRVRDHAEPRGGGGAKLGDNTTRPRLLRAGQRHPAACGNIFEHGHDSI